MITFVCWKWRSATYRHVYTAAHVEALRAMVARHYGRPHRFVCVTDDTAGLTCETVPLWDDCAGLVNASGARLPSCYRRLKMFAPEMAAVLGERVVSIDLDCIVTGDLVPLFDRPEPLVCWRPRPGPRPRQMNGSLILFSPGPAVAPLWEKFDPVRSPRYALTEGFVGSDQGWISFALRQTGFASWTEADGVHRWKVLRAARGSLPDQARIVFFTGRQKPWDPEFIAAPHWVRQVWGVPDDRALAGAAETSLAALGAVHGALGFRPTAP